VGVNVQPTSKPLPPSSAPARQRGEVQICKKFNEGRCNHRPCKFLHLCLECSKPHPFTRCPGASKQQRERFPGPAKGKGRQWSASCIEQGLMCYAFYLLRCIQSDLCRLYGILIIEWCILFLCWLEVACCLRAEMVLHSVECEQSPVWRVHDNNYMYSRPGVPLRCDQSPV